MPYNIRIVSTYPPRKCGIGTFSRDLANALEHFTGEIGHIRLAAIDKDGLIYHIPVDLVINQYDPESWRHAAKDIISRAAEATNPTIVLLQHEYGLDPDQWGNEGLGNNFVEMAKAFKEKGITTLVYLHTVLDNPNERQKEILLDLAVNSDGLIVTTESAIEILESKVYGIERSRIKHIDHGIRMNHPSQFDRLTIKEQYGIGDRFLVTTLGLLSPDKGVLYGIRGYGRFLDESLTKEQRHKILYLIAGECHPEFVKADGGRHYQQYQQTINQALDEAKVKWCRVKRLVCDELVDYDVVLFENFVDESTLLRFYGATNVMLLPYLNMQQISSGVLADTIGSGRITITTKFRYALELIHSNRPCPPGLVIGRFARGILIDPGEDSIEQIAQAIDYLVFNKDQRLRMEKQAHQRGYQMRWYNSAWALLQHIDFIREEKEIVSGRGLNFIREKESRLQRNI